jgi:hypothetical protein
MAENRNDLKLLVARVDELDARRLTWKRSPENPLPELEAEIFHVLEQLIDIYPNVTEGERNYIRLVIESHPSVAMYLQAVATGDIRNFRSEVAPERLQPALIAVSMANTAFGDYRDLLVLLGSLWLGAAQAGMDPAPFFRSVATLSDSAGRLVDELSMNIVLANFQDFAYFKEDVKPYLAKASTS